MHVITKSRAGLINRKPPSEIEFSGPALVIILLSCPSKGFSASPVFTVRIMVPEKYAEQKVSLALKYLLWFVLVALSCQGFLDPLRQPNSLECIVGVSKS